MDRSYLGSFNYYLGSVLKTYYFERISEELYLAMLKVLKLRATRFVDACVVSCDEDPVVYGRGWEIRTLVDTNTLQPRPDSQPTLCKKNKED